MQSRQGCIIVDHRERAAELLQVLAEEYGFQLFFQQLSTADYLIRDTAVERKTVRDFGLSLVQGRLFSQAFRLVENRDNPIMLIEGASFSDSDLDVKPNAIRGALITLAQTFRLPILYSRNQRDSAWILQHLWLQRQCLGAGRGVRRGHRPKRLQTRKLHLLQSLPGVGRKTAERLLQKFGSVEQILLASPAELSKDTGLGKTRLAQIHEVLHETPGAYVSSFPIIPDLRHDSC